MDVEKGSKVNAGVRGLPRPLLQGLPAPYSGEDTLHGHPNDSRFLECRTEDICAICGTDFADEERRYVATFVGIPGILLDDGLIMHERCAKISLAHCPHMREGFSQVFWVHADELTTHSYGRSIIKEAADKADERRLMLKGTSVEPNLNQPWRPPNEDWPAPKSG